MDFLKGTTTLAVTDTFTISALHGSNATGLSNSFVEGNIVTEPSTWAMMLIGFAGLGYAALHRRKSSGAVAI